MGSYLLCSSPLAAHPYLLRETGLMVYSAEELCYYIYHNFYLIDEDFCSDELLAFLEEELGLTEQAMSLRKMREENQGIAMILLAFLRMFHYYTEMEIKEFQVKFEDFRHYGVAKRKAMKADFLLEHGHYLAAIQIYHLFDGEKKDASLGAEFYMKVKQHMAVGYIRLGLYQEALEAYVKAYEEQPTEELLRQMYQFSLFTSQTLPGKVYQDIRPAWEVAWREEFENVESQGDLLATTGPTVAMFTKDSIRRKEALGKYIEGIKKNYRIAIM